MAWQEKEGLKKVGSEEQRCSEGEQHKMRSKNSHGNRYKIKKREDRKNNIKNV